MAAKWVLKDFLKEKRIRPSMLATAVAGKVSRTSIYKLSSDNQPDSVRLDTLSALLPALSEITGEEVTASNLITHEPDPKPDEGMDAESKSWLDAELAPPLEPYDWGDVNPEALGQGRVEYVAGEGWVVVEGNE